MRRAKPVGGGAGGLGGGGEVERGRWKRGGWRSWRRKRQRAQIEKGGLVVNIVGWSLVLWMRAGLRGVGGRQLPRRVC